MTVRELADRLSAEVLSLPDPDREVSGGYAGDLLSWVMGRARAGCCWVTIMTNLNVPAVAWLADVACVIIAESADTDPNVISAAESKGINLLRMPAGVYGICIALGKLI